MFLILVISIVCGFATCHSCWEQSVCRWNNSWALACSCCFLRIMVVTVMENVYWWLIWWTMLWLLTLTELQWQESCQEDQDLPKSSPEQTQHEKTEIIFFLCALYAIAATVLLVHDMRKNPRTQLIIFYIFANLTLICKSEPTTKTWFSESLLLRWCMGPLL